MANTKTFSLQLRFLVVICYCAYVIYSLYFNSFGANATVMMDYFSISKTQQGLILTAQSVGMLGATIFLALWGERYNKINALAFGTALFALGAVAIGLSPFYASGGGYVLLLLLVLFTGIGFTFIDVMVNGIITDNSGRAKKTLLPLAHAFFGVGSMCAPLLVTAVVRPQIPSTFASPFSIIGAAAVVLFICLAGTGKKIIPLTLYADMREIKKQVSKNPAEVFLSKESWILLAASVCYYAYQIGVAMWLPAYCQQILGVEYVLAGRMLTMFFGGSLVMRFLSPLLLKKIPIRGYYFWFALASCACMSAALTAGNLMVVAALVTVAGFLQGANASLLVLMGCDMFPRRTASASAVVMLAVGISSMIFPFVMGTLAESAGFLSSFLFINACCALSAFIVLLLKRRHAFAV